MGAAAQPKTSAGKPSGQQKPLPAKPQPAPVSAAPPSASNAVQKAVVQGPPAVTLPELDLSTGELAIPDEAAAQVQPGKDLDTNVRLPGLAEGALKLRKGRTGFNTVSQQGILLHHPALARFSDAHPLVLALTVKENKVSGFVGLGSPGPVKGNTQSVIEELRKGADLLQWAGLTKLNFPTFRNRFEAGVIDLGLDNLTFTLGGFLSGSGSAALDNKALSFEGGAKIAIPGGGGGELGIKKDPSGALFGKLDIQVQIGSVSGTVQATLYQGFVSVMGKVGYTSDRLSGSITLAAVDEATARDITLSKPSAGSDVPIELPGPGKEVKPGKRAFCGWGTLTFRVTDWLAGAATVIVNSKGQATIIGEIAPPKQFTLFELKPWRKQIFKLEIKAGYGIPVVGQVGLFANIGLFAVANVGPGILKDLKLSGAYSTDPRVAKNLAIEGTINIGAYAGLELSAEAGVFVTILGHDIKAGVNLTAKAGVRGYVEATPRIGMRELAPGGKREYFIEGHMEIAAQPVLGFSGDLFVAIETPWWSPLSDHRWTWPLFSLEYPLPGEFGIGADVSYILGSKKWPEIEFGEVDFDSSKFMDDLMNDNTDKGGGKEKKKKGDWAEGAGGKGPGGAKNKGGSGKTPAGEEGIEPVGEEETFSDGGETHRIWFETKGSDATLMMASGTPEKAKQKIEKAEKLIPLLLEADKGRAESLSKKASSLIEKMDADADRLAAMNTATRNAKAVYDANKNKKRPKGKKGKSGSKELGQKIKAAERELKDVLAQLMTLTRAVAFEPIPLTPAMHGGETETVDVVDDKTHAGLRVAKRKGAGKLADVADDGPLVTHAYSQSGRKRVKKDQGSIEAEEKIIQTVKIKGGQVNAANFASLKKEARAAAAIIRALGVAMRIPNLQRARQFLVLSLGEKDIVKFVADPAKVGKGLYRKQFMKNMREQLRDQQRGLREMSADEWFANRAKFSMDKKAFQAFDLAGRAELVEELQTRGKAAKVRADGTVKRVEKWIEETDNKKTKAEKDWQNLQDWMMILLRAEERGENAADALRHLKAVAKGAIEVPEREILKAKYEGSANEMKQRILGRQDKEKKEREKHKANLDKFLKLQTDWSELAKTGSDLAILHRPDQVAGGYDRFEELPVPPGTEDLSDPRWQVYYAGLRKMFGPKKVNELIGTQWKGQIEKIPVPLRNAIGSALAYPLHRMNLTLKITPKDE